MKIRSLLVPVLCALAMPMTLSAQGIADLGNPDDIMLRKPAVQKPAVPAVDAAAEQKARENAEELKRLREQVAAEKKAREDAAARAQAAEAAARAAQEQAQAAAEQAKAAEEAKAAAEQARIAAEAAQAKKPKLEAPVQTVPEVAQKETVPQAGKKPKKQLSGRPAVITADRTDYDRKEGVILFDRNVYVDDEQYQMHADRLFVFLDGTNDLKRLVALGNVSITNDEKSATCTKAVYNRAAQRITMFGDGSNNIEGMACLRDAGTKAGDASEIQGERITYWLDSGIAQVNIIRVTVPGIKGSSNPKDIFNPKAAGKKDKKAADEKDK